MKVYGTVEAVEVVEDVPMDPRATSWWCLIRHLDELTPPECKGINYICFLSYTAALPRGNE